MFWAADVVKQYFSMISAVWAWLLQVDRPSTTLGVAEAFQAISASFMTCISRIKKFPCGELSCRVSSWILSFRAPQPTEVDRIYEGKSWGLWRPGTYDLIRKNCQVLRFFHGEVLQIHLEMLFWRLKSTHWGWIFEPGNSFSAWDLATDDPRLPIFPESTWRWHVFKWTSNICRLSTCCFLSICRLYGGGSGSKEKRLRIIDYNCRSHRVKDCALYFLLGKRLGLGILPKQLLGARF